MESERPQDAIEAVLSRGDFVSDLNLGRVIKASTGGEPLDEMLVQHARVDGIALRKRLEKWMAGGISTPLSWAKSDSKFTPITKHTPLIERRAIGVDVPVLRALWRGVGKHLTDAEAKAELATQASIPMHAGTSLSRAIGELELDPSYRRLQDLLEGGRLISDLLADLSDRAGTGVRLLWFLEVAGAIQRTPAERVPAPRLAMHTSTLSSALPSTMDPAMAKLVAAVQEGYDLRMKSDYYSFLMISRSSPAERVQKTCGRLQQRWAAAADKPALPSATRAQVEELMSTLPLVYRTLADPARREEYDRRLAAGRAPTVGGLRGADRAALAATRRVDGSSDGASPGDLAAAQERLDAEDYPRAAGILDHLRMQSPSDPDVLAALGWARFHMGGDGGAEAAEDYLRLALTFEPAHPKALEYAAKVALDQGQSEVAESRLRRLLAKDPSARWARKALREIQSV
jgi:tetratricopeptide (TPR) repeat protein